MIVFFLCKCGAEFFVPEGTRCLCHCGNTPALDLSVCRATRVRLKAEKIKRVKAQLRRRGKLGDVVGQLMSNRLLASYSKLHKLLNEIVACKSCSLSSAIVELNNEID